MFRDGQWTIATGRAGEGATIRFVFGGANNADRLIRAGRFVQLGITVLLGIVIALWARQVAGATAAVFGVALWVFNPLVLAYGHLILNDMDVALMMALAVWAFSVFLQTPTARHAILAGLASGAAIMMKFSALLLGPMFLALGLVWWLCRWPERQSRPAAVESGPADRADEPPAWRRFWRWLPLAVGVTYAVILLAYAPCWKPAPPIAAEQAAKLNVPGWFQLLRPVLIPPDFYKGLAIQMAHAKIGHASFLAGEWRLKGWWYYFPVALALKFPLPLLALTALGPGLWLSQRRRREFAATAPWVAALTYLGCSMAGTINIGIRYMLPLLPLLAVGIAAQVTVAGRGARVAAWLLTAWLAMVAVRAHPHFLEYFNECAGGPANGCRWLVDSNCDWGQDVKRLKSYLAARGAPPVYLAFFGSQQALDYYGIRRTPVSAVAARALRQGTLIVSASELMRRRWDWLRAEREPVGRIGYTLFVYQLGE